MHPTQEPRRADHAAEEGGRGRQPDSSPERRELTRGLPGERVGPTGRAGQFEKTFDWRGCGGWSSRRIGTDGYREKDDPEETDRELLRSSFHRVGCYAAVACATLRDSCSLFLTIR